MKILTSLLFLASYLSASDGSQLFNGTWAVDMSAEERSSDTGPFFDTMQLYCDDAGVHQMFRLLRPIREGKYLSLLFPLKSTEGQAMINGQAFATNLQWRKNTSMSLLIRGALGEKPFLRSVVSVSADGRTLTLNFFSTAGQLQPDQVVVLRHAGNQTGKF